MQEFAAVLDELARSQGCTNVRGVTLQNELNTPGSTQINSPLLNQLYRYLDTASGDLRSQIRFMAGDLTQGDEPNRARPDPDQPLPASFDALDSDWRGYTNQGYWVTWMEQNMADLVDANSIRIYWDAMSDMPPHSLKFESRLKTISGKGKPLYVTEFGARRTRPAGTDGPGTDDKWDEQRSSYTVQAGLAKGTKLDFSSGTTTEAATSPTKHPSPWTTEARSRSTSLSTASSPSPPSRCHVFPQPELGRRPTRASRRGTTAAGGTDADAAARERHWLAVRRLLRRRAVARRVLIVRRGSPWLRLIVSASEW
jgi:hypothetical protein